MTEGAKHVDEQPAEAISFHKPSRTRIAEALSYLRSLFITIPLLAFATVVYGAWSLAVSVVDATGSKQHDIARRWARTLLAICGVRVRVAGLENLLTEKPCVLVSNHLSYMDIPVIFSVLPIQFRILARKMLFKIPFLGWHLRRSKHLPVDHANARASWRSLVKAAQSIKAGMPVFIFPEGGRSLDGNLREFVHGASFLALQAGAPVVPMLLSGTREVLKPDSFHIHPHAVTLVIGPPIAAGEFGQRELERLSAAVRERMLALAKQLGEVGAVV